jgi:hypothetical protein
LCLVHAHMPYTVNGLSIGMGLDTWYTCMASHNFLNSSMNGLRLFVRIYKTLGSSYLTNKTIQITVFLASHACKWSLTQGIYWDYRNQFSTGIMGCEAINMFILICIHRVQYSMPLFPWLLSKLSYTTPL